MSRCPTSRAPSWRPAARLSALRYGRSRRRRAGYTVVEVLMALSVLAVGATGVIAMQKATLVGNTQARNLATANAIAQSWLERLQVDGMGWTTDANGNDTILQTRWLSVVGLDHPTIAPPEDVWFRPATVAAVDRSMEAGADVRGLDTDIAAETGFCTHVKLTQTMPNLIRAEVRVFWLRRNGGGTIAGTPLCDDNVGYVAAVSAPGASSRYHFVHLVGGITRKETGN
ncbi:MAG: prepilin-type N-terminal cleavage/methylation domain-containing protein [Myxococcota bacterium]